MENTTPYEIIGAPYTLYVAAPGTARPAVDAAPGVGWTKVGTSGDLNYAEAGVTVEHSQTVNSVRAAGSTGTRKALRTSEDLKIKLELMDLTPAQYAIALNDNGVTAVAAASGIAGTKSVGLTQGTVVREHALLLRGPSPLMEDGVAQYWVPIAVQSGNPSPVFSKGAAAGLAIEFMAIEDASAATPDARFGVFEAQSDVALP